VSETITAAERPVVFGCEGDALLAILHPARAPRGGRGVVVVVGGPQYRVGSHRQFVLLARDLAAAGYPVLRFDYRGLGDSEGSPRDFEAIDADIRAAVDVLCAEVPEVQEVVLWGLCDAASAAAFYGFRDARVAGLVLLNPWVRTGAGEARTQLRHYYRQRLLDPAFWRKAFALEWNPVRSVGEALGLLARARSRAAHGGTPADGWRQYPLPERMRYGLTSFEGRVLLILSGNDLTARQFEDTVQASAEWRRWLASPGIEVQRVEDADHTFSRAVWRDRVAALTRNWLAAR